MVKAKKETKDLSVVKAVYRNLRSSPRKVNNLLRSIRGKKQMLLSEICSFLKKESQKKFLKQLNQP